MQSVDQPYEFKQGIFCYTCRIISNWALYEAVEQRKLAEEEIKKIRDVRHPQQEPTRCRGVYEMVYGIPCKHKIIPILRQGGQLEPEMFDRHWWLKRDISEEELRRTRIFEPKVQPRKRKLNKTGLRIPSSFEFADLNHPASRHPREFPDPLPPQLPSCPTQTVIHYQTHLPSMPTPQIAEFVTPFLPGRSHNYSAYTREDSTSSQPIPLMSS
ncbi:hypothetical protein V8E54_009782 [Elaphomyces granulatus]